MKSGAGPVASPVDSLSFSNRASDLVIHAAHATVTATTSRSRLFLLRRFGDQALSGQQQTGNRRCVLQRCARDFLGIHYAGLDQVFINTGSDVITVVAFAPLDFLND